MTEITRPLWRRPERESRQRDDGERVPAHSLNRSPALRTISFQRTSEGQTHVVRVWQTDRQTKRRFSDALAEVWVSTRRYLRKVYVCAVGGKTKHRQVFFSTYVFVVLHLEPTCRLIRGVQMEAKCCVQCEAESWLCTGLLFTVFDSGIRAAGLNFSDTTLCVCWWRRALSLLCLVSEAVSTLRGPWNKDELVWQSKSGFPASVCPPLEVCYL